MSSDEINKRQSINIRTKPTIADPSPPSPKLIEEDLRAAVQLAPIESLSPSQFRVKDPEPRQPAPLPESVSPAGVEVDLIVKDQRDLPIDDDDEDKRSEFKIDLTEHLDYTLDGKSPTEYKRNVKGTLIVLGLLLVSIHLFLAHCDLFSYLENFYTSIETIVATLLYIISTLCIMAVFLATLTVPALSITPEKFKIYYSPVLVAGGLDFVAVLLGGGIFSPLHYFHSKDPFLYLPNLQFGASFTLLLNASLYFLFTRSDESKMFGLLHPFQRAVPSEELNDKSSDEKVFQV